jgi:hypothetical protein
MPRALKLTAALLLLLTLAGPAAAQRQRSIHVPPTGHAQRAPII